MEMALFAFAIKGDGNKETILFIVNPQQAANRAYLASCLRHFAQIQPDGWTSDTLGSMKIICQGAISKV